ncbi:hypothetical protein SUGI_0298030 [Cryptomeria japonica]|nr:hypothetical protein SUGI_0298030 [Cryptomeria japonica]
MGDQNDHEEDELYADLYEDLEDGRQLPKTSILQMEERISEITNQTQELQIEIETLRKQNHSLQRDKDVLIRNISCLFKTAQMEIARKNKQINDLRKEVSQLKTQESHPKSLMSTEAQIKIKSEELLWDSYSNKVQDNGRQEPRDADALMEMDRLSPYDTKAMNKVSGDKNAYQKELAELNANDKPIQYFRDTRRPRLLDDERSSGGIQSKDDKNFFKGHHENRMEENSFRHDKRECQSQKKVVMQDHHNGNDQVTQHWKQDRVSYNEFRDYRTSQTRERDGRSSPRSAAFRSMNEKKIFSGDASRTVSRNSSVKRKVSDAAYTRKIDSYDDSSLFKIRKSNSFVHNRSGEKRFNNA